MGHDETAVRGLTDLRLIRLWMEHHRILEFGVKNNRPTADIAQRLGYVEREMERRGIRHDDPRGDVLDSHGVWHKA